MTTRPGQSWADTAKGTSQRRIRRYESILDLGRRVPYHLQCMFLGEYLDTLLYIHSATYAVLDMGMSSARNCLYSPEEILQALAVITFRNDRRLEA
jgi:hypothetical protein